MQTRCSRREFLVGIAGTASLAAAGLLAVRAPRTACAQQAGGTASAGASAASAAGGVADAADAFPSWNADADSLARLTTYVEGAVDETSSTYVPPEARVAVFDMDGTILCERDPIYFDWSLLRYRVLEDPDFKAPDDMVSLLEEISTSMDEGVVPTEFNDAKEEAMGQAFAGMTPEEFIAYVTQYMDSHEAQGFSGMTYGESFYRPMLEVISYLQANDFDVYIVTACSRFIGRAFACDKLGFRPDHVIGTDDVLVASGQDDTPGEDYTFQFGDEVLLSGERLAANAKTNKVTAIVNQIGVRPVLAFGNSSGDYAMAEYACTNPEYLGEAFLVLCDDVEREYGDADKAASVSQECEAMGWVPISMRDDWATIYGEGVVRAE